MDSYDRALRRRDFVIVIGLIVAVCLAIAAVARGEDGDIVWDEGGMTIYSIDEDGNMTKVYDSEVVEAIPFSDSEPNTFTLPFPDGTTWTEGEPSPWVKREEFEAFQKWVETRCFCPDANPNAVFLTPTTQYNQNKGE